MPAEPRSPHRRLALFLAAALVAAAPVAAGDSAWSVVAKAGQASASQDFGPRSSAGVSTTTTPPPASSCATP